MLTLGSTPAISADEYLSLLSKAVDEQRCRLEGRNSQCLFRPGKRFRSMIECLANEFVGIFVGGSPCRRALGEKGDVLFCFSTSGESLNVINAMKAAIAKDMTCIALTGKGGGEMGLYAHVNMVVPSNNTQRVQELHLHVLHTLCSIIEEKLFRQPVRPYLNGNGQLRGFNGKAGVKISTYEQ